jgi:hypothetical protein
VLIFSFYNLISVFKVTGTNKGTIFNINDCTGLLIRIHYIFYHQKRQLERREFLYLFVSGAFSALHKFFLTIVIFRIKAKTDNTWLAKGYEKRRNVFQTFHADLGWGARVPEVEPQPGQIGRPEGGRPDTPHSCRHTSHGTFILNF